MIFFKENKIILTKKQHCFICMKKFKTGVTMVVITRADYEDILDVYTCDKCKKWFVEKNKY